MHDGSVREGDQWPAAFLPPILASDTWGLGCLGHTADPGVESLLDIFV